MIDLSTIDELARKLSANVPPGVRALREDMEQQFRAVLQNAFEKLEVVTREEFEVQQAVLARTREKLEALAAKVGELEQVAADKTQQK